MQQRQRTPRRAIMLVSVLFLTVLTLMFVSAAVALAPSSLTRTHADVAVSAARRASQGGIDWVRSRISQDPQWRALTAATFSGPGLHVSEGDGQVTGWVQDHQGWGRFRIRFNYQDGPTNLASNSDAMNDPTSKWRDFPLVSCNNLLGGVPRQAPLAAAGSSYDSPGPWTNTQLTVPANMLFLSVEGSYGNGVVTSGSVPTDYRGAVHKKTVQTMLRLGSNQPITAAAVMAAGNLAISAYGSPVQLKAAAGEPARLRTKGSIGVTGSITSTNGELMAAGGVAVSGTKTGITEPGDDGTGFFKIPLDKVRTPINPITLSAGVYVVTATGQVEYYNKNYADFADDVPRPAGTPISLPVGMTIVNNSPATPKYSIRVSKDLQINPVGPVTDFALIPDGGAPQSEAYGGVPAASAAPAGGGPASPPPTASSSVFYWFSGATAPPLSSPAQLSAWQAYATTLSYLGTGTPTGAAGGTVYSRYAIPGGGVLTVPNTLPSTGNDYYPWITATTAAKNNLANHLAQGGNASYLSSLQTEIPLPGPSPSPSPSASPSPGAPGSLAPKDLELKLLGGASGMTLANDGDIIIGAQIDGNGSAIVSRGTGGDITLIGTSTDLSSSAGTQLGLNLYATGNITIDAYRLDATGGSFGSVNLKGVIYSWHDIKVLVGDSTRSSPFKMRGSLVAYGGDPASNPVVNTAQVDIRASDVDITYDPSFVASLVNSGPFSLSVASWHEF